MSGIGKAAAMGSRPGFELVIRLMGIVLLIVDAQEPDHCRYLDCSLPDVPVQCPVTCAGEGWIDGGNERNCSIACEERGYICTAAAFAEHNVDIDSSDKVLAILASWNWSFPANSSHHTNDGSECLGNFGSGAAVPNFAHHVCYHSAPDRAADTFDCQAAPQDDKHRICWCHLPPGQVCNEGWRDGGEKQSCTWACSQCPGMVCTEEALEAHNAEVDSDAEVQALITTVGGTAPQTCDTSLGEDYAVPRWSAASCYPSAEGRDASTYWCDYVSPPGEHRLCYCHAPVPTTTTINGVPSFDVLSGPCERVANGQCIQSSNYPGFYGYNEFCEIAALGNPTIAPVEFVTESIYDKLIVNGQEFNGTSAAGLEGMVPSTNIIWTSDFSASMSGWKICTQVIAATTTAEPQVPGGGSAAGGSSPGSESSDSVPMLSSLGSLTVTAGVLLGTALFNGQ